MSLEALFKISHGLYIIGAKTKNDRFVGSCIDAVMIIEVNPDQVMVSLCQTSFTCQTILETGIFSLSVLGEKTPFETIKNFGFQSSRDIDKWKNIPHLIQNDLPYLKQTVARLELKTVSVFKTKTHFVFLCDVIKSELGEEKNELTYNHYQQNIRPQTKEKKEKTVAKWICPVCGYVYEGEKPFEELPEDFTCPICAEPKDSFIREC